MQMHSISKTKLIKQFEIIWVGKQVTEWTIKSSDAFFAFLHIKSEQSEICAKCTFIDFPYVINGLFKFLKVQ